VIIINGFRGCSQRQKLTAKTCFIRFGWADISPYKNLEINSISSFIDKSWGHIKEDFNKIIYNKMVIINIEIINIIVPNDNRI